MRLQDGPLMGLGDARLVAGEEGSAHLNGAGAEGERRRDPAPVHDAAGSNHWDADRVDNLRNEGDRPDHGSPEVRGECAAVRAGFAALGYNRVDARSLESYGLLDRGGCAN